MRKAFLTLLTFAVATGLAMALGAVILHRDNAYRVRRAQEIVHELQRLEIGKSDQAVADSIAAKIGNAPPPKDFGGRYNKENCAAPDRLERCSYIILLNDSPVEKYLNYPFLSRLGHPKWWGSALINVSGGTVESYSFLVWYKASNGHLRGFGARVSQQLPRFEPVQAHISDSYSVRRIEFRFERGPSGFGLESTLTPGATAGERQRASHIDFSCLAQGHGCGEICEVMPDAWKDFYEKLGHLDVERLGAAYLFCGEAPR